MKTLFTLIVLIIGLNINAQLFVTIEPITQRSGLFYNKSFKNFGVYGKAWAGKISEKTEFSTFKTNTVKIGAGLSFKMNDENTIYAGANYTHFFNVVNTSLVETCKIVDMNRPYKISFDIGVSFKVERFTLLMMSDFLNWESMIGISYKLHK